MIEYQNILDKNMLNVLKDILINIRDKGLSNNNHLYVTFSTNHQKICIMGDILTIHTCLLVDQIYHLLSH